MLLTNDKILGKYVPPGAAGMATLHPFKH